MQDTNLLIDEYYSWLKDKTTWKMLNDVTEITLPFLDRNNDFLKVYWKLNDDKGGYTLTDAGLTLKGLAQEGFSFKSPKRQKLLARALNRYDAGLYEDWIVISTPFDNLNCKIQSFVQAMLAVDHLKTFAF